MAGALGRPGQEREQMPFLIPSGSTISLTNLAGYSSIPPRGLQVSEAVRYLAAGRNSYLLLTSKGRLFCSHKGEPWEKLHTHGPVVAAAISPHTGAIVCLARLPDGLWLLEMDQAGRMHRRLRQMGADRWGLCFDDADTLAVYGEDLIYFDSSQWDHYEHVSGIANIRNGSFFRSSLLALTRESVLICDLETHQHQILMRDSSVPSQHVAASSSDNWTASWAAWSNWHKVFIHSENGIEVAEMPVAAPVTSLSFTPDEDFLAVGTAAGDVYLRQRSSQARPSLIMQQAEGIVSALSFTHDGSHMLIGTSRGRLEVSSMRLGNRSQAAGVTP
jgi:WD40 repeat protein